MDSTELFELTRGDRVLVVTPTRDLSELAYTHLEAEADVILQLLDHSDVEKLVLDFEKTEYFGSSALSFFVKLWKRIRNRSGKMALCGLSDHEKEVLQLTKLDSVWPIFDTREEALAAIED